MQNKDELLKRVKALFREFISLDDVLIDQKTRYEYLKQDIKNIYNFIDNNF